MRCRNRFWQCSLKLAVVATCLALSTLGFAQDEPAAEASSASASASSASSAPPEKPLYADTLERDNVLLANALTALAKTDELQWLETPNEKILALYKTGETRKTKGVLLIMHAPESPQLWPTNLENLRRHLPLAGWATMALPLPAKYPITIPQRESSSSSSAAAVTTDTATASSDAASSTSSEPLVASSSSSSSSSAKPIIARDMLIGERVEAAVAHLNKLGQFNLVIMVDNSSAPDALAGLYKKISAGTTTDDTINGPLQALILVNLQDQEPLTNEQLTSIFSVSDLPVMDVFFRVDDSAQKELRRTHQAEAMRKDLKDYQQLILPIQPPVTLDDTKSFWLTKVHGFMERKAKGNEVKGK